MTFTNDCIAAVSTPSGNGGIAIIRLSGEDAFFTADKVFCRSKKGVLSFGDVSAMEDHTVVHGYIFDTFGESQELIDEVLVTKMAAPRSYTAENTVEINCHGGFAVATKVLSLLLKAGARAAEPGEFTKRAFLNGRIDLSQAESVMDIINAKTESGRKAAVSGLSGRLGEEITSICAKLTEAAANIDVSVDYPEYEFDEEMGGAALRIIDEALEKLGNLSRSYERGRLAKEGVKLVIAGAPNAGKSSLMNIFSGSERSIVTDIPGTTRDVIDEQIQLFGFPVWVTDTAGLRDTEDVVEKIGVSLAKQKMRDADLLLYVCDTASGASNGFEDVDGLTPDNSLIIANKMDLAGASEGLLKLKEKYPGYKILELSAKTKKGVEELFDTLKEMFKLGQIDFDTANILTSERHKQLVDRALELLTEAKNSHLGGMPLDMVACDLRLAIEKLCEILGKNVADEIINNIFSRFCVGK